MRREESSNFPTLFLSPLIILFVTEIQARALQPLMCPSSYGGIKKISYPFLLKPDPARCGDRDYELSCESNQTILELDSGKYHVTQILYEEHLNSLVDVNLANGSCSLPYSSLAVYDGTHFDNRYSLVERDNSYAVL
ncbi:hypothetical protein Ddye_030095 [Dipteronia dyeriana]|uniref:Wall-associated receptor kinase galacturonan-binding domain-containing protein n=1 Tax=Dipteronia dyeriana TaxID=168575 RepID=A0AAD9TGQ8_9ROSI|nr:hypothetical protein Ddye_030095 [Dipteronia dyeriana]